VKKFTSEFPHLALSILHGVYLLQRLTYRSEWCGR
jgi:hypothetical protein